MKTLLLALAAAAATATPAFAKPVDDCSLRDAPFSIDTPMLDIMFSDAARGVLSRHSGGRVQAGPPRPQDMTPPTYIATISIRSSTRLTGLKADELPAIDQELRALPITAADKLARCARYDNDVPQFNLPKGKPHLLLFEKINGFKDTPSVDAARAALVAMAQRNGWALVITDKGGAFNPATLRQFDAVIWNNISGDVLTLSQRRAFKSYLESGGGFVGIHGSGGDPSYAWDWYADTLLGARFLAHPHDQQFQDARIIVNKSHSLAANLPATWTMNDEWYSFRTNPRTAGAQVLLSLDESTYSPIGSGGLDLRMGDHPLAWTNCIGPAGRKRGRMFYSAIGHRPETYSQPQNVAMLEAAIGWTASATRQCTQPSKH